MQCKNFSSFFVIIKKQNGLPKKKKRKKEEEEEEESKMVDLERKILFLCLAAILGLYLHHIEGKPWILKKVILHSTEHITGLT